MAYKTLFETIQEKTGGKQQSREWYRTELENAAPKNIITDERSDEVGDEFDRDTNLVTSFPRIYNLMYYD